MRKFVLIGLCILLALASTAAADVGLGISPSKTQLQVTAGDTTTFEFLVFNTGDIDLDVTISTEGDIVPYVTIMNDKLTITPEPKPHQRPIRNGQTAIVTFTAPRDSQTLQGTFVATASPGSGTLGGSVSIASIVDIEVLPTEKFTLSNLQWMLVGALIGLLILYILWRRAGLSIKISKAR